MYRKFLNWFSRRIDSWIKKLIRLKGVIGYKIYMDDFDYQKSDIFIATFPRSGTTLLQMILYQITTDGEYNFDHLYDVSPWIKNDVYEGIKANKKLNKPRIIKTHDPYKEYDPLIKGKTIFVIRDGLDAMYSQFQQRVSYGNPDLTLEEFSKSKMENNNANWFFFNEPWLENKKNKEILYLTYNDIVNNKESTVIKICKYLNIDIKSVNIERVLERTSLEYMKKFEDKFGERVDKDNKNYDYTNFIRKGSSGEGKKEFNNEVRNFYSTNFNKHIEPLLTKRGLSLK